MANKDLLKEAIADAKAVKEVAIANAKLALEEAFTPHLKSMLSAKLEEMDKEDDKKVDEYGSMKKYEDDDVQKEEKEDKDKLDEINLDELLAELDEEMSDADKKKIDREADAIRDDADQISKLAKDAGEDAEDIKDKVEDDKAIDAVRDDMDQISKLAKDAGEDAKDVKVSEEINEDERTDAEEEGYEDGFKDAKKDVRNALDKMKVSETELKEAYDTIKTLKSELNEINLLNAKLLYTNKIFRNKNLTEAQKVKILNAFDKATSVKEVKIVFETLNENIKVKTKSSIKENLGYASKATGRAPKTEAKPTVEVDPMVARFKKLAGIING